MLEEYKLAFRRCADLIPGWENLSKNELCCKYVESEGHPELQNSYFSAIMYRYWHLIIKYYNMSENVASPEDAYEWLEDSVFWSLKLNAWNNKDSSIYKDPNGPDKMINRCMKCARLTYYQFINRKKRRDNFGMASLDELAEQFGSTIEEPSESNTHKNLVDWAITDYILKTFNKKDYFTAFLVDGILSQNIFDDVKDKETGETSAQFNQKKLVKFLKNLTDEYIEYFSDAYNIPYESVEKGVSYFRGLSPALMKAKVESTLERLRHDEFFVMLRG